MEFGFWEKAIVQELLGTQVVVEFLVKIPDENYFEHKNGKKYLLEQYF